MTVFPIQAIFNRGELTDVLHSRIDLEYFRMSYKYGENFVVTRHGGLMNRPGTKYLGMTKDQTRKARLVKFVFSRNQVYQIEFGHNYLRFWANDGQVISVSNGISAITNANPAVVTYIGTDNYTNGERVILTGVLGMTEVNSREFTVAGVNVGANTLQLSGIDSTTFGVYSGGGTISKVYEVATTYTEDELADVQFAQSNDVIYIAHKNHPPAKLQRFSETNWVLSNVVFIDGPYLPSPEGIAALLNHSTVASPTWPVITEIIGADNASNLGDKNEGTDFQSLGNVPRTIRFDAGVGQAPVLNNYIVVATDTLEDSKGERRAPRVWEIYGTSDLVTFTRLHGRTQEIGWGVGEARYFEFTNDTGFRYYEFRCLAVNNTSSPLLLSEIYWGYNGDYAPTTTMTFTNTTQVNSGAGLTVNDIGRAIAVQSSNDSKRRWFRITGVSSPTVATGRFYGFPFRQGWHIQDWQLGAFSIASGWPGAVAFYLDRLVWARTNTKPLGLYLSRVGGYENYSISSPLVDDDAITINIASSETEEIIWLIEGVLDLVIGTSANIRTLGKGDTGKAFSPSNFSVTKQTGNGSANVTPSLVGSTIIYPDYHLKALREFLYSFEVDSYVSPEVSILSDHLLKSGITGMDYASSPEPILWIMNGDGEYIGLTYDKENKVVGLHRSRIAGRTATNPNHAVVESISVIPGLSQDDSWLIVERQIGATTKRYVERVTPYMNNTVPKEDAWYLDCALEYSGAASNSFSGLSHLAGETISIYANNTVYTDRVVNSLGVVTLPGATTATRALLGIPQSQYFDLLQPVMETPDGLSFNRKKHSVSMIIDYHRTKGLKVGTERLQERIQYRENGSKTENPTELSTGFSKARYDSRWEDQAGARIVQDKPYPAFIRSIMLINDGEP